MDDTDLHTEALEVYNFINIIAPICSWGYEDILDDNAANKVFKLVKSEEEFTKLLHDEYAEITSSKIVGIRIAFGRGDKRIILPAERKEKEVQLRKVAGNGTYEEYGRKAIEILYPETTYSNIYQIYVPTK